MSSSSPSSPPYELLYWPTVPGRGEFIRLCFEETGTPYTDTALNDPISSAISAIKPHLDSSNLGSETSPPPFAPPLLRHGDLLLSQTPAILLYLAGRLGLGPRGEEEVGEGNGEGSNDKGGERKRKRTGDGNGTENGHGIEDSNANGVYIVHALALTILDGLSNEAHDTHHPIAIGEYYENQKPEAARRAQDYRDVRLPKFLDYFERVLNGKASQGGEWLYGGALTYADLVLAQALRGVEYAFPKRVAGLRAEGKHGKVFALGDRVWERKRIREYVESGRRVGFGNGIYRRYEELDGEGGG